MKKNLIKIIIVMSLCIVSIMKIDAATYVAKLTLNSTVNITSSSLGHSWITIENTSSSSIIVGKFSLAPGKKVTIGTWGNLQWDGVWYNAEIYNASSFGDHRSISMSLTSSNLATINNKIDYYYNVWSVMVNCSTFAEACWNSVSSTKVSAGVPNLPTQLTQSIASKFTNDILNNSISTVNHGNSYYYNGTSLVRANPSKSGSSSFSLNDIEIMNEKYNLNLTLD